MAHTIHGTGIFTHMHCHKNQPFMDRYLSTLHLGIKFQVCIKGLFLVGFLGSKKNHNLLGGCIGKYTNIIYTWIRHGQRWVSRQGEQALRFKNAAADNAQSVDLLVTVAEESDYHVNKAVGGAARLRRRCGRWLVGSLGNIEWLGGWGVEFLDVLLGCPGQHLLINGVSWGDITHWS